MRITTARVFVVFLFVAFSAFAEETVGYYIGSFDMVTMGHKAVVASTLNDPNLKIKKIYITVNWNTDKDFNASMEERVEMMRRTYAEFGDRVEILREPLEGRPEYARYLIGKHQGKVLGIFGDDTFDKNFKIFTKDTNVHDFDYVKVARPEPAVSAIESVYVPIVHDHEIEADGTSSSAARKAIAEGKDPSALGLISKEAYEYIKERGLYQTPTEAEIPALKADFEKRYREFVQKMELEWPGHGLSKLPMPEYKSTQSLEAQSDKFVRHLITNLKLSVAQQYEMRPKAEKLLGIRYPTKALRSNQKAGIYFGSFDGGVAAPQKEAVREALKNVEVLYVAALGRSAKEIKMPLEERVTKLKEQLGEFGGRVVVTSLPSLEDSPSFVKRLRNEHGPETTAFFGTNVFQANYDRLKGISNLKFAALAVPGSNPQLPPGVPLLGHSDPCGLGNVAPNAPQNPS